ncbi:MAG: 1-acyl-sn-glycerol-3-phosphate acyltransferase [Bacteroidales bacterium]|nr:1-acyl-sn-glycerol-3-phosphate acyltransferase [Bacteroidales bacterium]
MTEEEARRTLTIDVDKIVAGKSQKVYDMTPRWLLNYLKKTIHQDDINDFIVKERNRRGIDFANDIIGKFKANLTYEGLENVPEDGRYIFASNHPMGGLDGMAFISAVGTKFKKLKFPVNDMLLYLKNFSDIFLPVSVIGNYGRDAAMLLEEALESDNQILIFPAGLCSRKQKGEIRDLEWKKMFVSKALAYKRDIVPVYISGRNSNFFYNLANIRKMLGVKFNIEMLYLPDEMYKQEGKDVCVRFGEPIKWESLVGKNVKAEVERIKEIVYSMK